MPKKILHGLDGSKGSLAALAEAIELAKRYGAELHTISVEEVPHYAGAIGEVVEEKELANHRFAEAVAEARRMAAAAGVSLQVPCHCRARGQDHRGVHQSPRFRPPGRRVHGALRPV